MGYSGSRLSVTHALPVLSPCHSHRRRAMFITDGNMGEKEGAEDDSKLGKLSKDVLAMHQITLMIVNHPDVLYQLTLSLNHTEDKWRKQGNVGAACGACFHACLDLISVSLTSAQGVPEYGAVLGGGGEGDVHCLRWMSLNRPVWFASLCRCCLAGWSPPWDAIHAVRVYCCT